MESAGRGSSAVCWQVDPRARWWPGRVRILAFGSLAASSPYTAGEDFPSTLRVLLPVFHNHDLWCQRRLNAAAAVRRAGLWTGEGAWIMLSQAGADEREIENGVDAAQQVIGWNVSIYAEDIEELRFPDLPPHHRRAPSLTQAEGITTEHSSQQRVFHRYRQFLRQTYT